MKEIEKYLFISEIKKKNQFNEKKLNKHYFKAKCKIQIKNSKNIIIFVLLFVCICNLVLIIIPRIIKEIFNSNSTHSYNKILNELNIYKIDEDFIQYYNNKTIIRIFMSLDNNLIYPTLVSMTSALENNDKEKNILKFYLLLSKDFENKNLIIFESLKQKYQVILNYYIIPNIFENIRKWRHSDCVYYKLLIPLMFPNFERAIYFDSDTLIFKDLLEMYNLPFNNNYVLGYPFHMNSIKMIFGITPINLINGGVLLINIKEIRRNNMDFELLIFTIKNTQKLLYLEQDSLNYVYNGKIGLLPLKYGIYLYGTFEEAKKHYLKLLKLINNKIDFDEVKKAIDDPAVVHLCCCNPKIWNKDTKHERNDIQICLRFQKEFYYYANKTSYYSDIYNKYMK